ncbi:MAG: ABC transporter ATP-binding protein [Rhodospirillales bacterium]|nr:ABC transporter ATP-binding protein [Rhodospirillales bacterium]
MAEITIDSVTKIYGTSIFAKLFGVNLERMASPPAVDDVSLHFAAGERIGIIGQNGAGKSTLLHMIAGTAVPSRGAIDVSGRVNAILSLGTALREELSGRENIKLDAELLGMPVLERDRVVEKAVKFVDIGEYIDKPLYTYSTGMKSRVAFAMNAFHAPEILIIDEALSVGDAGFAEKAEKKIRELCDGGLIVIIVSHDLNAIQTLCRRCIWMSEGRVIRDGAAKEVVREYREQMDLNISRKKDDAKLSRMTARGAILDQLRISVAGSSAAVLRSAKLNATVRAENDMSEASIRFAITRLDGMPILDNGRAPIMIDRIKAGQSVAVEAEISPFPLFNGSYLLKMTMHEDDKVVAEGITAFEINDQPVALGGDPVIKLPFTARPLSGLRH